MIKITEQMKQDKQQRIDELCKRVDNRIKDALAAKLTRVCFPIDKDHELYHEVKALYEAEGYKIIPTGFNGGVWQLTEDITW